MSEVSVYATLAVHDSSIDCRQVVAFTSITGFALFFWINTLRLREMNLTSRISNQTTINYAKSKGIEIAKPRGYRSSPPRDRKKSNNASATKNWVWKTFTNTLKPSKNSASIFPDVDTTPPSEDVVGEEKKNPVSKHDHPAVYFDESRIQLGAEKFKFCLVGKFPGPKPSLEKIREWAGKEWKLQGDWSITALDRKHVFVRLESKDDMIRVWPRNRWFIGEHLMKIFKWFPTFRSSSSSSAEPSLAAVWITFPHLPVVFFQEYFLHKIASLVGKVFCMDEETRNMSRTSMARVCVEVDLVKEPTKRLWVGIGKEQGFWQDVYYESMPSYCTKCSRQGHQTKRCSLSKPEVMSNGTREEYRRKVGVHRNQWATCPVFPSRSASKESHRRALLKRSASFESRDLSKQAWEASAGILQGKHMDTINPSGGQVFDRNVSAAKHNEKSLAMTATSSHAVVARGTSIMKGKEVASKADNPKKIEEIIAARQDESISKERRQKEVSNDVNKEGVKSENSKMIKINSKGRRIVSVLRKDEAARVSKVPKFGEWASDQEETSIENLRSTGPSDLKKKGKDEDKVFRVPQFGEWPSDRENSRTGSSRLKKMGKDEAPQVFKVPKFGEWASDQEETSMENLRTVSSRFKKKGQDEDHWVSKIPKFGEWAFDEEATGSSNLKKKGKDETHRVLRVPKFGEWPSDEDETSMENSRTGSSSLKKKGKDEDHWVSKIPKFGEWTFEEEATGSSNLKKKGKDETHRVRRVPKFGEWASDQDETSMVNSRTESSSLRKKGEDNKQKPSAQMNTKVKKNSKQNQQVKHQKVPSRARSPEIESTAANKRFLFNKTILFWRRKPRKGGEGRNDSGPTDEPSLDVNLPACRYFSMEEIRKATKNFAGHVVLGDGGFGTVYKGVVDKGTQVAIKRLSSSSEQGMKEFQTEINMLSKLKHTHLVSLVGVCMDSGERMLLYDFMSNGSLNDLLYHSKNNDPLQWKRRLEICTGAARGLNYLHRNGIIHRDVKTTNILVDHNWEAKLSDFGLSREGPAGGASYIFTKILGTPGYWDPEYLSSGHLTIKSDVYSFGVVLLEVLFGRPPGDRRLPRFQGNLKAWARHCSNSGILDDNIDPTLRGKIDPKCLKKFVDLALLCVEYEAGSRPTMQGVLKDLESLLANV